MALTSLSAFKDRNGYVYPLPAQPGYVNYRVFAAATAETPAVPTGANFCVVIPTVDTYVDLATTAVVPSSDITDGSGPTLVPAGYPRAFTVTGLSTFSVIASAAGNVALEFYS